MFYKKQKEEVIHKHVMDDHLIAYWKKDWKQPVYPKVPLCLHYVSLFQMSHVGQYIHNDILIRPFYSLVLLSRSALKVAYQSGSYSIFCSPGSLQYVCKQKDLHWEPGHS